jgi:hypothetical protein
MNISDERRNELKQKYIKRRKKLIAFYELALKYARQSKRIHVLKQKIKYHKDILKKY